MCTCKPGVSGRACDSCQKQYVNFASSGCSSKSTLFYLIAVLTHLYYTLNVICKRFCSVHTIASSKQLKRQFRFFFAPKLFFSFILGCSACPQNLQNMLDTTVIVELVNISIDLADLQSFGSTDDLFQNTTKRLEMAKV